MTKLTTAAALVVGLGAAQAHAADTTITIPTCNYQDSIPVSFSKLGDQLRQGGAVLSMTANFLRAELIQTLDVEHDESFLKDPEGKIIAYTTDDGKTYGFSKSTSLDERSGKNVVEACAFQLDAN